MAPGRAPLPSPARRPRPQVIEEGRLRVADIALAGQEDEDVAVALRAQFVHRVTIAVSSSMASPSRSPASPARRPGPPGPAAWGRSSARLRSPRACPPAAPRPRTCTTKVSSGRGDGSGSRPGTCGPDTSMTGAGSMRRPEPGVPSHGRNARETVRVDRRRRDDDLEVRARGQQARQVAQDEVDVEAALVGLVDDDRVVAAQHRVGLDLRQQDAVRHELDEGAWGRPPP